MIERTIILWLINQFHKIETSERVKRTFTPMGTLNVEKTYHYDLYYKKHDFLRRFIQNYTRYGSG